MPTYIDESGDTGRVDNGGKPYFRLAAVWTPTDSEVRAFQDALPLLRQDLGLKADYEFKFSKTTSLELREAFFNAALSRNFRFAFSEIDKRQEFWHKSSTDDQHRWCAAALAVALRPAYEHQEDKKGKPLKERVLVDDNRSRRFLDIVKLEFVGLKSRIHDNKSLVGTVEFRKSHTDPWLQLVDMVCGAVGSRDGSDARWHELISDREVNELSRL